jgi:TMEM175 potassium channel family protein
MGPQLHNELKKEFQLERLILFSDAVFAIAITLFVIEIRIPEPHGQISDKTLLNSLGQLIPKFVGILISFILIGLYWTIHHRMFGFVTSYNRRLIILNLVFLFFIVLMPFSTGFYSEYAGNLVRVMKTLCL